ncbi:MAG TPA: flagellar FlbD family protein [Bdellovibrionota bacterium]|jgi:flagellar protein FlbD
MIVLHRLNGKEFVLNAEQIKFVESTPDTMITLATESEKFMVKESVDDVLRKVIEYKQKWLWAPPESRKN